MESPRFAAALDELVSLAASAPVAFLCAEADPSRCHRSLIADALLARRVEVAHIVDDGPPRAHQLTRGAVVAGGRVSYPGPQASLPLS
jgi:uncharacterized protein (DUF488 family)